MSYGNSTNKRFELPPDYQEVLVIHEIQLSKGLSTDILRKMVYLYTTGMEYYNIMKKKPLEQFYNDKLLALLTRPDVIEFLDKHPINFNDHSDLDLFSKKSQANSYGVLISNTSGLMNNNPISMNDYSTNVSGGGVIRFSKNKHKLPSKEEMMKRIRDQINSVDVKLSKVDERTSQEIVEQMSNFEARKRKQKVRKHTNSITRKKSATSVKSEDSNKELEKRESKEGGLSSLNPDLLKQLAEMSGVSLEGGLRPSAKALAEMSVEIPARKRRVSIGQNLMLKEIEEYVEKNMNEMYKALDELKESFETEIKEADENGYPEIANGLREDMELELENMKDQYEEQRRVETDKIRAKYQKRGSYCRA